MKLKGIEIFNLVRKSLKKDTWEDDNYTIGNEDLDVRIWVCNGISHTEIYRYNNRGGVLSYKRIRLSLYQKMIIYSLYLRKVKKLTVLAPIGLILSYIIFFPLGLTTITSHNFNKSNCVEEMEFNLDKSEFREHRLSKLLENES
ncbi:MAG: hypothetical protein SLAVMIC_00025 [uncultured marine phage]|uniref:Uncharacterized protein n=1 Tax=uncultured marine phage TaxID=707152 RepID=A0A8D9FR79_9VIRU|nr:MAG: hypothetical protein SLAVMIC_00025 [uncultured marine phage]